MGHTLKKLVECGQIGAKNQFCVQINNGVLQYITSHSPPGAGISENFRCYMGDLMNYLTCQTLHIIVPMG